MCQTCIQQIRNTEGDIKMQHTTSISKLAKSSSPKNDRHNKVRRYQHNPFQPVAFSILNHSCIMPVCNTRKSKCVQIEHWKSESHNKRHVARTVSLKEYTMTWCCPVCCLAPKTYPSQPKRKQAKQQHSMVVLPVLKAGLTSKRQEL